MAKLAIVLAAFETGKSLDADKQNVIFLNWLQYQWSYRFLMCSRGDFDLAYQIAEIVTRSSQGAFGSKPGKVVMFSGYLPPSAVAKLAKNSSASFLAVLSIRRRAELGDLAADLSVDVVAELRAAALGVGEA